MILIPVFGIGQFVLWDCPQTTHCISSTTTVWINSFSFVSEPNPPVSTCGSTNPYEQHNLRFEATSSEMSVTYTATGPAFDGFTTISLLSDCEPSGMCLETDQCIYIPSISTDELIVGADYIISIVGCNSDLYVNVEMEPGNFEEPELPIGIELNYIENCSSEPFCKNGKMGLKVKYDDESIEELFNEKNTEWIVSVEGPASSTLEVEQMSSFEFSIDEPGTYEICLQELNLLCNELTFENLCTEVTIHDDFVFELGDYDICEHVLAESGWTPGESWEGDIITEEGFYEIIFIDECGCKHTQRITVNQLDEVLEEVEIELCPEDYPYEYFNEYVYDYQWFDIEEELEIYQGSIQRDYENNKCDSLVLLKLINEDAATRCSSCELPVSLGKSKIIYCIPFDNEAIDISGKNNIVNAVGIDFDDNGSSNNALWDALFDGNLDYVVLPHFSDLNTADFSLDFKFNKDEDFENGPIETLFSKGDSEDNLRYIINVEQVTDQTFNLVARFY
ncbi:MAG: hypothetical protein HKO66_15980, partial [Saprospiraceae bacterium]|nr:hypothetical protein [Saprospiraceae bacterium]